MSQPRKLKLILVLNQMVCVKLIFWNLENSAESRKYSKNDANRDEAHSNRHKVAFWNLSLVHHINNTIMQNAIGLK